MTCFTRWPCGGSSRSGRSHSQTHWIAEQHPELVNRYIREFLGSRLLDGCEHNVEVLARPRVRRGAASLAELSPTISEDLLGNRESDAVRLPFGFADDFRGSSRPGRIALIAEEPPPTGDARFDAALAGIAEFFAAEAGITAPVWANGPGRFVEPWWFVASRPAFDAYTLANTPALFARHGVFMAREVFDRA
jgi:hypothetical protein